MEFEEAHNNLRAMRLLYRLLEDDNLGLQNENSELVGRARVLLKSILDVAAEKALETYLKITATQAGISKAICTSEPEETMASQQLSPLVGTGSAQSSGKYPTYSNLLAKKAVSGPSNSTTSVNMGINSMIWPNKDAGHHQGNSSAANLDEFQEIEGDFSKDIVNSVKRLESRILTMHPWSNMVDSTKNRNGHHSINKFADSPVIQKKNGIAGSQLGSGRHLIEENGLRNQQARELTSKDENLTSVNELKDLLVLTGNRSSSQAANQKNRLHSSTLLVKSIDMSRQISGGFSKDTQLVVGGESLKQNSIQTSAQKTAMMDRDMLFDWSLSGKDHLMNRASECIQGLMVPLIQDDLTRTLSMISSQTTRENPVRNSPMAQTETEREVMRPEPSKAPELTGSTMSIITGKEKQLQRQKVTRTTLLDRRPSEVKLQTGLRRDRKVAERGRSYEVSRVNRNRRRILPGHGELEESDSSSRSYASWTTWTSSASRCNSEDDSLPSETPTQHYMGPISRRMVDVAYNGSSEESSISYSYKDIRTNSRVGSLKSCRFHRTRQPEKAIGRLRKLKNKLGFIFHHHHHHHHDHGDVGHRHSMWNNLQKTFRHKNKHEEQPKGRVAKTKAAVAKVPRKNEVGHVHALVEGFLRHIRQTKKPTGSKVSGIQGSRNIPRGHGKKLHWWQMIRYRQRMKLNNRGRVKMGFVNQKLPKNHRGV